MLMKKALLLLIGLWAAASLSAQDRTQKTRWAHLNLLGLHYNYAFPLGERWTVTPHIGLSGELGYSSSNFWSISTDDENHWFYTIRGSAGVDLRYYYNLTRRMEQGRKTAFNSGNFFSVDLQYLSRAFVYYHADRQDFFVAYPAWGMRRVYQSKYLIEVTAGALVGTVDGNWRIRGPRFDLKMGIVF